jgi:hypothetical protein
MMELPLGTKRLKDGEEWRTPHADSDGRRCLSHRGVSGRKNEGEGGRTEVAVLLTGSRSHVNPFDATSHVIVFGMTTV